MALTACVPASDPADLGPLPRTSVVIVTFDGVRPRDLFDGPDREMLAAQSALSVATRPGPAMPYFVNELGPSGAFVGRPGVGEAMTLANPIGVSLPGYQSMFAGRATFCFSNECGAFAGGGLFGHLRDALDLPDDEIAMFASWQGLCDGIGATGHVDATCGADDIRALWRRRIGAEDPGRQEPPDSIDQAVFELAIERLRGGRRRGLPTLLYVALDETDGTGHAGDYLGHLATLDRYDAWLRELDEVIRQHESAGRAVTLIVSTDHGRGSGEAWDEHRWNVPGSQDVWLFARGPEVVAAGAVPTRRPYTLAAIRPTIERLMGLEPTTGPCRGRVIEELFVDRDGLVAHRDGAHISPDTKDTDRRGPRAD